MRIFSVKSGQEENHLEVLQRSLRPHSTPVVVLAVDGTSTLLATGGTDGVVKVWDIIGGYVTHTFHGPSGLVSALKFVELSVLAWQGPSPQRSGGQVRRKNDSESQERDQSGTANLKLASGSQNGQIRVWDLQKRSCIARLDSHVSSVRSLDYSAEKRVIVSGSRDKTMIWWDTKTWKTVRIVPCLELVEAVGFVDEGRLTYSAGSNGTLRIWDTETGKELSQGTRAKSEEEAIEMAIFRPGMPFILCVQVGHTLTLYDPPTKDSMSSLRLIEPCRQISGAHDEIIDLGFVLPDRSLLALATNSEDIRLVSVADSTAKPMREGWKTDTLPFFGQDVLSLRGHTDIIISLDVDWSGLWVATGAKDNTARLWRLNPADASYVCWASFSGHAESLGAVALSHTIPADKTSQRTDPFNNPPSFIVTGSQDKTVKKWEVPRQAQPAGQRTALRAAYTRKAHDKEINAIHVHYSERLFASASQDKTVKIWSTEEGEVQGILRGHRRGVWSVAFGPAELSAIHTEDGAVDGKGVILTGSGDKSIKLWSLSNYTCLRSFEGHSNSVLKVLWLCQPMDGENSKSKAQFASAGGDGLIKVWHASSGEVECSLDNHEDRIWALAVQSKTGILVSGSSDSTITFWKDTTAETQAAASRAAVELVEQEQELQNYMHSGSYREAITLALQLNHPGRLLSVFTKVVCSQNPEPSSLCGLKAVDEVLAKLSDEQIFQLLTRIRDWNKNARTAPVAQRILWTLMMTYPASKISGLSVKGLQGQKSLREVLHALRVYTERHYRRMEELVDESYLVEYTLQEMDSLSLLPAMEDVVMQEAETEVSNSIIVN